MGVTLAHHGATALLTLNWPERRNALGLEEGTELGTVLRELSKADDVAVVVLTGKGTFCSGGNLPVIAKVAAEGPEAIRDALYTVFHGIVRSLVDMPVPVLAAVDGPAIGLGMDLALACDWRAIGPDGWFRQGWAEFGVIPGMGGELLLRRLAPSLIWSLLGSARRLGPADAAQLGLADATSGHALDAALERAAALAEVPSAALRGYVSLHRAELREQLDRHLDTCLELQVELLCSDGFQSRVAGRG